MTSIAKARPVRPRLQGTTNRYDGAYPSQSLPSTPCTVSSFSRCGPTDSDRHEWMITWTSFRSTLTPFEHRGAVVSQGTLSAGCYFPGQASFDQSNAHVTGRCLVQTGLGTLAIYLIPHSLTAMEGGRHALSNGFRAQTTPP